MTATDDAPAAWTRDEVLRPLADRLAPGAAPPRVVSFDFFDTLVSRLCADPSDLFVEVGRRLAADGLLRHGLSPSEFRTARLAADEQARAARRAAGQVPEIRLEEIYAELGDVVTDPAAARDLEFAVERGLCFVNPAMRSLAEHVRALGCRTAIVSDTWLTAAELLRLLEDQGVPAGLFDEVLASCELGRAKWLNGTLYHELLARFDAHPGEVLHVGDNLGADVHQARRLGIDALHYQLRTPALKAALGGEQRLCGPVARRAGSLEGLRVLAARQADGDQDPFRDGAFVLGPVLARFADWCVERYERAGVRRVLALMREGELLGELVSRSAAARGVPLEVVTCYASRMATARAALPALDPRSAAALLEGATRLTPQAILEILGIGEEAAAFVDEARRQTPLPSGDAAARFLEAAFRLPGIRELIEARHRESHALAFEYLAAQVGDARTVGVLDLGWSGSIQRNVARILRRGGLDARTVGCYLACTKRAGRLALEGQEAHAYFESEWDRNAILAEVCTTACVGSTRGYARDAAGEVRPVLEPDPNTPAQRAAKDRIRDGVLAFQSLWLPLLRGAPSRAWSAELTGEIDRFSPAILFRWMDYPTRPEADRLASLHHDENYFGTVNSAEACDEPGRARLREGGVGALIKEPGCFWPQGVLAQVQPRLVSVLRERWSDPAGMGRLGAYDPRGEGASGLTAEEAASLGVLLAGLAPDQVVFCGAPPADLPAVVARAPRTADATAGGDATRLVVAGPGPSAFAAPEDRASFVLRIAGALGEEGTQRRIRGALRPGASVALVLDGDVPAEDAAPLLHALAPFLGPRGTLLLACGRYDRHSLQTDHPLGATLREWLASAGTDLGFGLWEGKGRHRDGSDDWIVVVHAPDRMIYNRQWMATLGDAPHRGGPPAPAAAGAPSADGALPTAA